MLVLTTKFPTPSHRSLRSSTAADLNAFRHRRCSTSPEFAPLALAVAGVSFSVSAADSWNRVHDVGTGRGLGDGLRMGPPSVSTAVITTAAAVAVPAAQSSSAAPMSIANHMIFWEWSYISVYLWFTWGSRTLAVGCRVDVVTGTYLASKSYLSGKYTMNIGYEVKLKMNETGDVTLQGKQICIPRLQV
ncbi:hypothetical protein AKJ16_DCAP08549 [Drosera capensis]